VKLAFLILVAAMNPALAGDLIQTNQPKSLELWSIPPTALIRQPEGAAKGDSGLNWKPLTSTNLPMTNLTNEMRSWPTSPQQLKSGLYKTSPYTLLVWVPGPQRDDCSITKFGTAGSDKMPVFEKGLKFTPYSFAEK
jgi:hypothetical protein